MTRVIFKVGVMRDWVTVVIPVDVRFGLKNSIAAWIREKIPASWRGFKILARWHRANECAHEYLVRRP